MARYYYDRYNVSSSTTYTWSKYNADYYETLGESDWYPTGPLEVGGDWTQSGYTSYSFTQSSGFVSAGSWYSGRVDAAPHQLYDPRGLAGLYLYSLYINNGQWYKQTVKKLVEVVDSGYTRGSYISATSGQSYSYKTNNARNSDGYWWVRGSSSTTYSRGSYVDTITAEDGTYPTNGRVGTTYWYVRGSILTHTVTFKDWDGTTLKTQTVNDGSSATPPSNPSRSGYSFDGWSGTYTNVTSNRTITATYSYIPVPPGTPSSITVPTDVKGGKELYISWGSSSGASRYYLYRSLDSGTYVSIYSGTSRNYTDIVPKGTSTVSYRVRGYNSDGYSSYRTSPIRDVKNFPEMKFKVNSNLATSDKGWVKVNGELKEIDTIWTMINGILKEVE